MSGSILTGHGGLAPVVIDVVVDDHVLAAATTPTVPAAVPAPRTRRATRPSRRRPGWPVRALRLVLLPFLPVALLTADTPGGGPRPDPDLQLAAWTAHLAPDFLPWAVPLLVLGLLLALVPKEKSPVSDNSPVPQARNGESRHTDGAPPGAVPVCGIVRHHDGSGVPDAALTLIDVTGRQSARGASGRDGRYALSTPGPGAYVLIAAAGGHQPQAIGVTVADRPVELDVVLGGSSQLTGRVLTPEGEPVPEATVTLTDAHGDVAAVTRTGRNGGYTLNRLVAGEYTLAASAPAYRPAAVPVAVHGTLPIRQNIELAGRAVLRGTVRAVAGQPVPDARVTLLDNVGGVLETQLTGSDGRFVFTDLGSGMYTVIAAGYPAVATEVKVTGGERTDRDVHLSHGGAREPHGPRETYGQ